MRVSKRELYFETLKEDVDVNFVSSPDGVHINSFFLDMVSEQETFLSNEQLDELVDFLNERKNK